MNRKTFRNAVLAHLGVHIDTIVQQRPHTYVGISTKIGKKKVVAHGFSKVSWPDRWSEQVGVDVAFAKARRHLAREIFSNGLSRHKQVQRAIAEVSGE